MYNSTYIKILLKEKNITTLQLMEALKCSQSTISRKLSGETAWHLEEGFIISNLLNMPLEDIFKPSDEIINSLLLKNFT